MIIRFVYGILPVIFIITNKFPSLVPITAKAWTPGFISLIKPGYTEEIIQHELVHSKQSYKMPFIFWILYCFEKFRLQFEVEAYAVQAKWVMNNINSSEFPTIINTFTNYLAEDYSLSYTRNDITNKLLDAYKKAR